MVDKLDIAARRDELEGFYTFRRIVELRVAPVGGAFDVDHLKEINRRIFQDLPGLGFDDVTPGRFRDAVPAGVDWVKHRQLETANVTSHVCYSDMDAKAIGRLGETLGRADPKRLRQMKTGPFVQELASLYAELDYIHPFRDGNSRTLREFTRELAEASGFHLQWEYFGQNKGGRDALYVARDRSVNELALPNIKAEVTRRDVVFSMDQLEGNKDLAGLLKDAGHHLVRPARADAFQRLPEAEAVLEFPELKEAYATLRRADFYSATKVVNAPQLREQFVAGVRATIQEKLNAGETQGLGPAKPAEKSKSAKTKQPSRSTPDRER
ncbi:Fic family protein (plasmid) [Xanthomonas citri pv. fuscans]|uniref:Fic family protein n=1 Tax=Xanthomonas citri TaxID=346 RepID=UPI002227670B|nr:Fic family protein [Xanthomonas citri]UZB06181.1 Fic family protein [Xanthomonas citri pv. fuscans]